MPGGRPRRSRRAARSASPVRPDAVEHALVLDDVEHGERRGGADRVAAERAEEHGLVRRTAATISRRVMTAATGWPLPIGLPSVTKSGTMPKRSNAHSASPVRPWPAWTSSAIHSPPAACVRRTSSRTYAGSRSAIAVAGEQAVEDRRRRREAALAEPVDAPRSRRRRDRVPR